MNHLIAGWYRYARRFVASYYLLNWNALLGRSFVPRPRIRLFLEPTSYCNLGCKFCSYPKNVRPRAVMDEEIFEHTIDQAAALGYRHVVLTPTTGEVFTDKRFVERLRYIERSPIKEYSFYSNFIGVDEAAIANLLAMPKLVFMEISVYGHDLASFLNITTRGEAQYRRLIENLGALERLWSTKRPSLEIVIGLRTYQSFEQGVGISNELLNVIRRLQILGAELGVSSTADNWGGDITKADLADIDMSLTDGRYLYKKGPCGLLFDGIRIASDGQAIACACRDTQGALTVGDIRTTPLSDIISVRNEKWMKIIADQEAGRFNDLCNSCGFYRSIHDSRRTRDPDGGQLVTKEEYFSSCAAVPGTDYGDSNRNPSP